jgi:endonuclease/exonuclease/phosphatase family metal-dependent hydrolase
VDPKSKPGMPRLLLEAVVRAPFGDLRVMTTHLEYYSPAHRAAQVEAIRQVHAQACAHAALDAGQGDAAGKHGASRNRSGSPFHWYAHPASAVLTADFNFRPEDPLHARLQAPFDGNAPSLRDCWQVAHPGVPHQDTNGVHDRIQWPSPYPCDFIFATTDLVPRVRGVTVDGVTQASDHQPVLLELD